MQDYTLRIPDSNTKAATLLNYLKTLDFIEITKVTDWYEELEQEGKHAINKGLDDLKNDNIHSDISVRKSIHERILKDQNK